MENIFADSQLKIHTVIFAENIYPWIQNRLFTPYWRFYWNPIPGGCLRIGKNVLRMTPRNFYVIPGYLEFDTFAESPFAQFYIHFNLNDRLPPVKQIFEFPAERLLVRRIRMFCGIPATVENSQFRTLAAISILSSALLSLPREILRVPGIPDRRIEGIRQRIVNAPDQTFSNRELARQAGLACNSFIRLFRLETGESPQRFARRKRIEAACEMLHFTNLSISEIAEKTGFADRYHFSRIFARTLRIPPAMFRRCNHIPGSC